MHISYDLAKELRDAGWPQEADDNGSNYALPVGYTFLEEAWRKDLAQPNIPCKIPTLEELIEACEEKEGSDGFKSLLSLPDGTFAAWSILGEGCHGSTPTEAVARLWLSLNPKKV